MSETTTTQSGADLIAAERQRQIEAEGWTTAHDDDHSGGEMAMAAACYALPAYLRNHSTDVGYRRHTPSTIRWPWDAEWWKPTPENRIRELVKAGALIAAEIDRLQREASHA